MNLCNNGLIIQAIEVDTLGFVTTLPYLGLARYKSWPLESQRDSTSKELSNEANQRWFYYSLDDGVYPPAVVPEKQYCMRYLRHCELVGVKTRILFCQTSRAVNEWKSDLPAMQILGFDYAYSQSSYSAIPDDMLGDKVPDLLIDSKKKLNKYGLFETESDILSYIENRNKSIKLGIDLEPNGDFVIFHLSEVTELI